MKERATARTTADGFYGWWSTCDPTHRKVRDGWGTRAADPRDKKAKATAKTTADPYGMTTKYKQRQLQIRADDNKPEAKTIAGTEFPPGVDVSCLRLRFFGWRRDLLRS